MINYFVSLGDCCLHKWQKNFLIKSFKFLNKKNKLHISLSSDNKKSIELDCDSIKVYHYPNKGKEKEYLKYNKWYCLYDLLKNNIVDQPVVVLEPHVVFSNDIEDLVNNSDSNILYQQDKKFIFDENYLNIFSLEKEYLLKYWLEFGDIIIFKNVDVILFENILNKMKKISLNLNNYKFLDKLALIGAILESNKKLILEPMLDLESNLHTNSVGYFINYNHGFKNIFQKNFYKTDINFCGKSIKQNLSEIRYTECLDFLYKISEL
jgi:hypothetical protein